MRVVEGKDGGKSPGSRGKSDKWKCNSVPKQKCTSSTNRVKLSWFVYCLGEDALKMLDVNGIGPY